MSEALNYVDADYVNVVVQQMAARIAKLEVEAERLRAERDAWMETATVAGAHICCEECQSDCDHVPGFGFDESALAGTEAAKCRHGILRENCFACVKGNPLEVPSAGTEAEPQNGE